MNIKQFITIVLAVCVLAGGAVAIGWLAAQDGSPLSRGLAAVSGADLGTTAPGQSTGGGSSLPTRGVLPGANDNGADGTPVLPPPPPPPTNSTNPTEPVSAPTAQVTQPTTPPTTPLTAPPTVFTPSQYRPSVTPGRSVGGTSITGLKIRDSGSAVTRLQRCLVNAGTLDNQKVSGVFDRATRNALFLYQNGNRAPRTGIVDAKTTALMASQGVCEKKIELPEEPRPLPPLLQEA